MSRRILVVEDEQAVLHVATSLLSASGYEVLAANSVAEARILLSGLGDEKDLCLLVDVVLEQDSGVAFAEELIDRNPGYRVLFMSGFTDDVLTTRPEHAGRVGFLKKPFSRNDMIGAIQSLCSGGV